MIIRHFHGYLQWCACYNGLHKAKKLQKKFTFGQFEPSYFEGQVEQAYNANRQCKCNVHIWQIIRQSAWSNKNVTHDLYDVGFCNQCYSKYERILERQSAISSVRQNLLCLAKPLSKSLWNNNWMQFYEIFKNEIKNLEI